MRRVDLSFPCLILETMKVCLAEVHRSSDGVLVEVHLSGPLNRNPPKSLLSKKKWEKS